MKQILKEQNRTGGGTKLKEIFSKKNVDNLKSSFGKYGRVFITLICLLIMGIKVNVDILATIFGYPNTLLSYNPSYERMADPNTMDDYMGIFDLKNNSRTAGRVWSDKTVFANGTEGDKGAFKNDVLTLDMDTDGVDTTVQTDTDFLHVFSTIGSSQVVDEVATKPLDVVLLLDISSSMTSSLDMNQGPGNRRMDPNDSLHQVIDEANLLISQLMGDSEEITVHDDNRVGVVVYGGGTQEALPLNHYQSSNNNQKYIQVGTTKVDRAGEGGGYFPTITTVARANGFSNKTTQVMIADSTYLQGALYQGMNMLAKSSNPTNRTPVLIVLTDGATNIVSATSTSRGNTNYDWLNPYIGIIPTWHNSTEQYSDAGTNPLYVTCGNGTDNADTGNDNKVKEVQAISTRNVSNLLLAGYYQKIIEDHYSNDMIGFSIGYNVGDVGRYATEQLLGTLNPSAYFDESNRDYTGKRYAKDEIEATRTALEQYINSDSATMRFPRAGTYNWLSQDYYANFNFEHPEDTEHDITKLEDVYYIDRYYTAESDNISDIFDQIFEQITGTTFSPVAGENASGVSDSLTYMDPIGEYMELKDKSITLADGKKYDLGLTLFGEMHGLVKTAIYDFQWNDTYMKNRNKGVGGQLFAPGWYKGTPEATNTPEGNSSVQFEIVKALPDGYTDAAKAWEDGWVYRIPWSTAVDYVPTLQAEDFEHITDTQKYTVYSIYRFDRNITTGETENSDYRNKKRTNPCYEKSAEVNYLLSDIRVWLEDTGNYKSGDSSSIIDNGFEEALYVNVPANALPLQVAKISLGAEGQVTKYETNVDIKNQSTPFRLYYGVGVQTAIMTEDGLDIDVAKLKQEYIDEHSQESTSGEKEIYFLSNYYSNTTYDGYVTSGRGSYTRGDPNFTFSPSASNRYYAFQKPLILYKYDGVPEEENLNYYEEKTLNEEEYEEFINSHDKVTVNTDIERDSYYWIIGEYYTKEGELVHLAVTRKGGEFGSEIASDDVTYSDYLVWYDPEKDVTQPFSRGGERPEGNYVVATKVGGLRIGNMLNGRRQKTENTTSTSYNYYIPTISDQSTGRNAIINGYLGNNGKLVIPNTTLEITKQVNSYRGDDYKDEEFNYVLQIDNRTGDFSAVNMIRSPFADRWQLRLDTIDVLTDNEGLLEEVNETEGSGHSHSLYKITVGEDNYYVYVGGDGDNGLAPIAVDGLESEDDPYSFRLYDASDPNYETLKGVGRTIYVNNPAEYTDTDNVKYAQATREKRAGTIEFWIEDAYLIPVEDVDDGEWHFDPVTSPSSYDKMGQPIVVSTLNPYEYGREQLSSRFATSSLYGTTTIYFGYGETPADIEKPESMSPEDWAWLIAPENKNKAKFTLKDGEGIFFAGLDERVHYVIYEEITPEQKANGYDFGHVYDSANQDYNVVTPQEGIYQSEGRYNGQRELHYVNTYRAHYDITLDKTVLGTNGDEEKEWEFNIKLTPPEGEEEGFATEYKYYGPCEKIDNECKNQGTQSLTFTKNEDGTYSSKISIKHNEKIQIINILSNTDYEITEVEANQNGYETTVKSKDEHYDENEYYDENTDILDSDKQVGFVNANWATHNLGIRKMVNGSGGERNREFTFVITLTPGEYVNIASSYRYDGSKEGTIDFTTNDNGKTYTGTITLKHNEHITIHDILENTHYKVTEAEANRDGYITNEPGNAEGDLEGDEEIEVQYVNTKYSNHELTIEKIIRGSNAIEADSDKEWEFKVTLTPEEDIIMATEYPYEGKSIVDGVEKPTDGTITFTKEGSNYVGTVKVKHGQAITIKGIPERVQYQVEEEEANTDAYTTTDSNNTSGIVDGQTVRFTNTKLAEVNLTISKEVISYTDLTDDQKNLEWEFDIDLIPASGVTLDRQYNYTGGTIDGIVDVTAPENGHIDLTDNQDGTYSGKITLKHGQSITINGLPELTKYVVKEVRANRDGYFTSSTNNRSGVLNGDVTVTFKNELLPPDSLTIAKEVQGSAGDLDKEWTFDIKLHPVDPSDFATEYSYVGRTTLDGVDKPTDGTLTFEQQEDDWYLATITLKSGQAITINDIPTGTQFEVIEREANSDGYHTSTNYSTDSASVTGTIEEDGVANIVLYTNVKTVNYNLTLSKRVLGALGDKNRLWNFSIRLTPSEYEVIADEYSYDGSKTGVLKFERQADGSYLATIDLKSSESITIRGISENTRYEIIEREANSEDYITRTVGDATGILDENRSVTFENIKLGSFDLTIKKYVKGNMGEKTRDFTFRITLVAPELKALEDSYEGTKTSVVYENGHSETKEEEFTLELVMNENGNYEGYIKLKDNETFTIKGLPEGTKYMITETDADDYITTYTPNAQGTIVDNGTVVEFTNYKYRAVRLTIEKRLKGNNVELDRSWNFEVTLSYDDEMPLNGIFPYVKSNKETGFVEFTKGLDGTYRSIVVLRGGEKITIQNLPYNVEYAVREIEANKDRYETTATNENGTLVDDDTLVLFVNRREEPNPSTGDRFTTYLSMFIISTVSVAGTFLVRRKVSE